MPRRRTFLLLTACVVGLGVWWYRATGSARLIPDGPPKSITVQVYDEPAMAISNLNSMRSVLKMFRAGRPAKQHNCASRGKIEIQFADGENLSMGFGPGHDGSSYEFGMKGHVFTIDLSRFMNSMQTAGFEAKKFPTE